MKVVFLLAYFVGSRCEGFADARHRDTGLRRGLKKDKQTQDHAIASGDSYFSYNYDDGRVSHSGDFSYGKGRTNTTGIGNNNSSEDHTTTSGDDPTIPVEEGADASGSNDSTYLERICDLYAEFESSFSANLTTHSCQHSERFEFLMCPEEYYVQGICAAASGVTANMSDAIMNQYCLRIFPENLNSSKGIPCSDLCYYFVAEADCCKVRCP